MVGIVDDNELVRTTLHTMIGCSPNLQVVAEAATGSAGLSLVELMQPDVVVMDISMPRVNGIEATRIIHREYPDICIIGLSMYEDQGLAQAMRDAGAADYRNKGCEATELVEAVRACVQRGSCHTFTG